MKNHHLHDIRGERKDQFLITVGKDGKRLGEATREECHSGEGKTHLAFLAFIVINNKLVLTKRAGQKSLWAGYWDASVVSHVLSGETVQQAAHRRGKEELGVRADFKDLGAFYYFAEHENGVENEYCHVLVGETKDEIHPNPVEIDEIKLMTYEKLKAKIKKNTQKYTPWIKLALEKIIIK